MLVAVTLLALIASAKAISIADVLVAEWKVFKVKHKKTYIDEAEEMRRFEIFNKNRLTIAKHNQRWASGEESYEMGVNKFADLQQEEFERKYLMDDVPEIDADMETVYIPTGFGSQPQHVDWRQKGAVTAVKDQGGCKSCWAFSATGAMEGQHFLKTKRLVSLSEQNLIDCVTQNYGCDGGKSAVALRYVIKNNGVDTEKSYPYKTKTGICQFNRWNIGATFSDFIHISKANETDLANAVATKGPVAAAINAPLGFQLYKNGVYNNSRCKRRLNHEVLVVGYGWDDRGGAYWLVKNSWSKSWGENGYIRMARGRNNQCGIADRALYPEA
ncbi:cathepsin L-like [Scaptodrosophila lebanonensis]|uniref:cathepsin L n=1 Tax=Drosophila lebanonensis TaxID=7225 RepID=A0A6J2T7J6_DROLE|nr:cathepsin L-like [Scaptodrosophila lebanonensis]